MNRLLRIHSLPFFLAAALAACGDADAPGTSYADDDPSIFGAAAKADGLTLQEGGAEALAVLRVANELSQSELDDAARLDRRAAANIVAARDANGDFVSIRELDAVKYVGVNAITRMRTYAGELGWVDQGSEGGAVYVHGIAMESDQARGVLVVANTLTEVELDDEVGLDSRAAMGIVAARPFADLRQLDKASYVGSRAFARLLGFAEDQGFVGVEVVVHGVAEGSADAQAILKSANTATQSQLDHDANLDSRAAANIVAAREAYGDFADLSTLDTVSYVGRVAFERLLAYTPPVVVDPVSFCGDGTQDEGEACDDGNAENGDGCNAACEIEVAPDDSVIHEGAEQCSGEPWNTRYTYTVISNPPRANTDATIKLRFNSRSPYSPTPQNLQLEVAPDQWSTVFTTQPAVAGFQTQTARIPAETINAAVEAMGWLRFRVAPGTFYVACSQLDVTYNCPECNACPEGQVDNGFGCQDEDAPYSQTLHDHSRGLCSRSSATLTFISAPEAAGNGTLSLQYLPCDGGRISVSMNTQNAGWVDLGTASTGLSCGFASASMVVPEAYLDAARNAAGEIQVRYNISDSCRPGMGCAAHNDPCVRRVNLTYEQ